MEEDSEMSVDDLKRFQKVVGETETQSVELLNFVKNMEKNLEEGAYNTNNGINLLELKNHLMLNYMIDLTYLMLKKVNKSSIKGEPAVERLAETRVVLERMRPIEQKMKYQIDKLVKLAATGTLTDADPLRFKPNLGNFETGDKNESDEGEESEEEEEEIESKKNKKYVPPKLMAMPYDEGDRQNRQVDRAKKRALSSSLIQDLHEQYSQAPEEIREVTDYRRKKQADDQKRRSEYEEDNLMRLQLTKKQQRAERRLTVDSTLNSLLSFGDYNVEESTSKGKKKHPQQKHGGKKQKGGKGKFKKRK